MARVLVTGGCGYIGSHVARAFKELNGDQVIIVDRVKRDHTLKDIDGWFIDDFASDASLSYLKMYEPDVLVHCAGTSLVGPSMTDPAEYYDNNIVKTIRMLDVIATMDKKPVILFSSSASVYGNPKSLPLHEDDPVNPISPYGSTKAMSELLLRDYGNAYGFDTVCFRYFNAAGAYKGELGQEPGATHIIARALEASINNTVFNIYGENYDTPDGTCIRDYVHVWDIALAHLRAIAFLDRLAPGERTCVQEVFNLGTRKGISNKQIADYVQNKYGLTVLYGPRRPGDPAELIADPVDARTWLGWEPVNSNLQNIIDSAHEWYTKK
jgi:UDP-glucose 4-epimerase